MIDAYSIDITLLWRTRLDHYPMTFQHNHYGDITIM